MSTDGKPQKQKNNLEADAVRADEVRGSSDPKAAARNMLAGRLGALGRLSGLAEEAVAVRSKTEKPPGFSRLPEKTAEQEFAEHLSTQEKLVLLQGALKEKPLTPQQKFLIKKAGRFREFARALERDFAKPAAIEMNLYIAKWMKEKYADQLRDKHMILPSELKRLTPLALAELQKPKQWFDEHGAELTAKIATGQLTDIESAIPQDVREVLDRFTDSKNIKTEAELYGYYEGRRIFALRQYGEYQTAQDEMEDLLSDEFKSGRKFLGETWISQIKAEVARGKIFDLYIAQQDSWRAAGMSEEQIQEYYNGMLKMEEDHEINKRIAEHILGKKVAIPAAKKEVYDQYVDMLGLGPWHNLKDEQWDTIARELAINAPLILASGGVAAAGRGALSKIALEWLEKNGAKWFGKKLLEKTVLSEAITATARIGAGMLTEGTLFEATHGALTGELIRPLPEWGKSILWSSITLGVFHGSGRISERFFTKEIGGVRVATRLGQAAEKISDKAVREAVKTLLLKGHMEAATMLFIGALQHGTTTGSFDEFTRNFVDELFHAYVSVGALKVGGKVMQPMISGVADFVQDIKLQRLRPVEVPAAEWNDFLTKAKTIKDVLGPEYASALLDMKNRFSDQDGADIGTWEARKAYSENLFKVANLKLEHRKNAEQYVDAVKNIPPPERGEAEMRTILRRARESLTAEERALPIAERTKLVRRNMYRMLTEYSRMAGQMMSDLEAFAREHPDATAAELLAVARDRKYDEFPASVKQKIQIAILRFERNRSVIESTLKTFTPRELFVQVFGAEPYGEVKIDTSSPFSIHLILEPVDLKRVRDKQFLHSSLAEVDASLRENPLAVGGLMLPYVEKLPALGNLIAVGRAGARAEEADRIFTHEERHGLQGDYFEIAEHGGDSDFYWREAVKGLENFTPTDAPRIFGLYKNAFLISAKHEIGAYLKDSPGRSAENLKAELLFTGEDALYDYCARNKDDIFAKIPAEQREKALEDYQKMALEYRAELGSAIDVAAQLVSAARSEAERNALLAELDATPIDRWEKMFGERLQKGRPAGVHTAVDSLPLAPTVPRSLRAIEKTSSQELSSPVGSRLSRLSKMAPENVPQAEIDGKFLQALREKHFRKRVGLESMPQETMENLLRVMASERPAEFEFLNREYKNLPHEIIRAIVRDYGVNVAIDGTPGRVYGGARIGTGGLGSVCEGFFISADGKTARRVVIKKPYYQGSMRKYFVTGREYQRVLSKSSLIEKEAAQYFKNLAANDPDYPSSLLKVSAVDGGVIVYEKVAMKNGESRTLQEIAEKLDSKQVKGIIQDAVNALVYLHNKGILHSDVKPSNIMISQEGGTLHGVLIDFGAVIGSTPDQPSFLRHSNNASLTTHYADPHAYEGTRAEPVNAENPPPLQADMYAMGVSIFEVIKHLEPDSVTAALTNIAFDCTQWRESGMTAYRLLRRLQNIP